eukprot:1539202-Prorocentrum_lima.AAC.1
MAFDEEEVALLQSRCHEQLLLREFRGMGVDGMYFLGKDLLDYDINNVLIPEDQIHLDNRLAAIVEEVVNRYTDEANITEMIGYTVMTTRSVGDQPVQD